MARALRVMGTLLAALALVPTAANAATANDLGYCGGYGQRACCVFEAVPSCDTGFSETGEIGGTCYLLGVPFPAGTCGNANPNNLSSCGGNGQRACCLGEGFPSCDSGNIELLDVSGGSCPEPVSFPGGSAATCWTPTPCGGEGQRACSLLTDNQAGCNSGLVELGGCDDFTCGYSSGWCYNPTPCGGNGERACCIFDIEGDLGCDDGLNEIAGASGDFSCGVFDLIGNGLPSVSSCVSTASLTTPIAEPGPGWTAPTGTPDPCAEEQPRGYADLHAHMFSHLGHGGAGIAGLPYSADGINDALRQDFGTYLPLVKKDGSPLPEVRDLVFQPCDPDLYPDCDEPDFLLFHGDHFIDHLLGAGTMEGGLGPDCLLDGVIVGCGAQSNLGAPLFNGWPTWRSTTHQQMYYKWLERAWRGGLRLMVQFAVTNEALCRNSKVMPDTDCDDEMAPVDAQIEAAYDFEKFVDLLNDNTLDGDGWFQIVTDPDDARDVIAAGNLAVVLGIEVANLFSCKQGGCLFEDEGGKRIRGADEVPDETNEEYVDRMIDEYYDKGVRVVFPIHNFENAFGAPATWQDAIHAGNYVSEGAWWAAEDCSAAGYGFALGGITPFIVNLLGFGNLVFPPLSELGFPACNERGLSALGEHMIRGMMNKGMMIDVDHMSAKAFNRTLEIAVEENAPVIASHVQFFDLNEQEIRHERMRTKAQLEKIRDSGGMIAAMLKDDKQDTGDVGGKFNVAYTTSPTGKVIADDCRHSSKTFAQMYQYSVDVMQGPVAMGSDWNGVAGHVGPRFGFDACGRDSNERGKQERAGSKLTYPFSLPGFGTFSKQVTGLKTFDYNVDGLAHVGLLPDFVADLGKIGLNANDLAPLFSSATGFADVWDRAEGSVPGGTLFQQLRCEDQEVAADASCNATVSVADEDTAETFAGNLTQSPAGPYSLGTTNVTLSTTETSTCGTTPSPCSAAVTVVDQTAPEITCPFDVTVECNPIVPETEIDGQLVQGDPGTVATYAEPTPGTDNCSTATLTSCAPDTGQTYDFGDTPVTCGVRDDAFNSGECAFLVSVVDTTEPTITCPADLVAECTGDASATVTPGVASGSDICAPLTSLTTHATASFGRGETELTYIATDHVDLEASCTSKVTVEDTQPPIISCPETKTAECTGNSSAFVTPDPASGSDVCASVGIDNPAAADFPMGLSTIGYVATDEVGLTASCTSDIVVEDTTPPTITCPDKIVAECQGGRAATVTPGSATGEDICASVDVSGHDEASFPLGTTPLSYTATDEVGLTAMCSSEIEVVDTTPPVIVCPAPVAMEPHDLTCGVTFTGAPTTVTDVCDPTPVVTSSVPVPATFTVIGEHTITFTATDQSENSTSCDWKVTVLPTSLCQKREAIDSLESLLAVDTGDQKLINAIDHLYVSVGEPALFGTTVASNPSVWGDPTHVDTCNDGVNGADVFHHEAEACKKLDSYAQDATNASFGFGAALEAVRQSLAAADRRLAQTAIEDATANGGKRSQISQASTSKTKGDAEAGKGGAAICDKAIDYYFDAWNKALKAWCPQE